MGGHGVERTVKGIVREHDGQQTSEILRVNPTHGLHAAADGASEERLEGEQHGGEGPAVFAQDHAESQADGPNAVVRGAKGFAFPCHGQVSQKSRSRWRRFIGTVRLERRSVSRPASIIADS